VAGDRRSSATPLLLLHDAPGSSLELEPLMLRLSMQRYVLTMDLPGCGESPAFAAGSAELGDFAALLRQVLEYAGVQRCGLYGKGFGGALALELANADPGRFAQLLLQGLCLPEDALRAQMLQRYAPDIALQDDGSHWYRCWLMLRDSLIYFPWYDGGAVALRRVAADFDPQRLHSRTFETVKQLNGYPQFIRAALRQDTAAQWRALAQSAVEVTLLQDPLHPFAAFAAREQALAEAMSWTRRRRADCSVFEALDALA
jgi:pimeloyl-ACP methyl ester carboxylesterase